MNLEQKLEKIESLPVGSSERLNLIVNLDLGNRSKAAERALSKRSERLGLMSLGYTHREAQDMVRAKYEIDDDI